LAIRLRRWAKLRLHIELADSPSARERRVRPLACNDDMPDEKVIGSAIFQSLASRVAKPGNLAGCVH